MKKLLEKELNDIRDFLLPKIIEYQINEFGMHPDEVDLDNATTGACDLMSEALIEYLHIKNPDEKWDLIHGYFVPENALRREYTHYWIERDGDYAIIDLTADQFGDDKIVITNRNDLRYEDIEICQPMKECVKPWVAEYIESQKRQRPISFDI